MIDSTTPLPQQPKYRADIDGLRAIAVLTVVGYHAFPRYLAGGFIGVDVFFVISGFLISTIIFSNLEQNSFSLAEFYSRRVRRLFPALAAVMISCFAFGWFALLADEYQQLGKHLAGGAAFLSNFFLWAESGYFDNAAETKPLLHLWSLAVEEQFYIVWPVLLTFAWKRHWLLCMIAVIAIASFTVNIDLSSNQPTAAFYSPLARFWEPLMGAMLAYFARYGPEQNGRYKEAQSIFGFALLAIGLILTSQEQPFPSWWVLLPTLAAVFIISAGPDAWLNRKILSAKVLVWVGLISYPLYLWHWPLLSFARIIESGTPSLNRTIAAIVVSVLLAWFTHSLIEKPIRFGGDKKRSLKYLVIVIMAIGCAGYGVYLSDGVASRAAVTNYSLNANVTNEFVGPLWKYTQNPRCLERFPFNTEGYGWWFCKLSKDAAPTIVLLGNSYANQLYPGLVKHNRLAHHTILSIGTCDPARIDESKLKQNFTNSPCSGYRALQQQAFIDNLIRETNSLRYAILAGLPKVPDRGYIARLKARIDYLEANKIAVIVVTPHLTFDTEIRGCFTRPFKKASANCELRIAAWEKASKDFSPVIERLSQSNPRVAFFDPNSLSCRNEKCSMVLNGMPLFRDHYFHISEYGSIELAKLFVSWANTKVSEIFRMHH